MRAVLALTSMALIATLSSCGGERRTGVSSCFPPYVVRASGQTITAASCAGNIPVDPMQFSVRTGARFTIEVGHEQGGRLDFPVPAPVGDGVRLLRRAGVIVTYEARSPGTTTLVARHTLYCDAHPGRRNATCRAAVIRVTAR